MLSAPAGRPTSRRELRDAQQRQACVLGGLDDASVARRERAADRAAENLQRIVPRNDVPGDAVRLAPREHGEAFRIRKGRALQLVARAAVELEVARAGGDVGARLLDRLAAIARLDQRKLLGVLENRTRPGREQASFLGRCELAPRAVARGFRGANRGIDVRGVAPRDGRERRAVRRVDHRQLRAARRRVPAIADEMLRRRLDRGPGCLRCVHAVPARCMGAARSPPRDTLASTAANFHASVCSSTRGAYVMPSRVAHRLIWKCSGMSPVSPIASSAARCRYASRLTSSTSLQRILGQRVHLGVRVAAAIGGAEALVLVERHQQRLQRRRRLAGPRAPAREQHAELEVGRLREERGRRHRHHLGRNAAARPHLRDRLRDLGVVDVAVVGRVQRDLEAVGIAGLRQQLLGAFRVERLDLEVLGGAEQEIGDELAGRNRLAFHHALDDRGPVDHLRQRLAHPRVLQRILVERLAVLGRDGRRDGAVAVHVDVHQAIRNAAVDRQLLVALELGDVGRGHVLDDLHVAGQQRRDPRRILRENAQRHLVPRRSCRPTMRRCERARVGRPWRTARACTGRCRSPPCPS